jgi:molecular chaperone DnaK (HSP70)
METECNFENISTTENNIEEISEEISQESSSPKIPQQSCSSGEAEVSQPCCSSNEVEKSQLCPMTSSAGKSQPCCSSNEISNVNDSSLNSILEITFDSKKYLNEPTENYIPVTKKTISTQNIKFGSDDISYNVKTNWYYKTKKNRDEYLQEITNRKNRSVRMRRPSSPEETKKFYEKIAKENEEARKQPVYEYVWHPKKKFEFEDKSFSKKDFIFSYGFTLVILFVNFLTIAHYFRPMVKNLLN